MTYQIAAIFWAQWRTIRNHLQRTIVGTVLLWLLSTLWYAVFAAIGFALAVLLGSVPLSEIREYLPSGLFGALLFWQIFPLMTLSAGWSLELQKVIIYPVRAITLFWIEVLLRLTTAPEVIIVLAGATIGLIRNPHVPAFRPMWLWIYLPLNLFLALAIREWALKMFRRKHLRELFVGLFLVASVMPNLLLNTGLGKRALPILLGIGQSGGTPWSAVSRLTTDGFSLLATVEIAVWLLAVYKLARMQFSSTLASDQVGFEQARPSRANAMSGWSEAIFRFPGRVLRDPLAALVEKELRILARSPRFRVVFGMACIFSVIVFFPFAFGRIANGFIAENYLPTINVYGLLIVGEVLLWNVFGFDRKASQIYFATPVPFVTVLRAKNVVAGIMIAFMTLFIAAVGSLFRTNVTVSSFLASICLTLVMTMFFMGIGNLTSIVLPRPIDPSQAFRNQNSAKSSLWLLLCFVVVALPAAIAFAAKWAFESDIAFFSVLGADLIIALIFYRVATESAVALAEQNHERLLDSLMAGGDPMSV
jgi:ABC-2 type transport system permease protein